MWTSLRFWTAGGLIGFTLTIVGFSIWRHSPDYGIAASAQPTPPQSRPDVKWPELGPLQRAVDVALEDEGLLGIASSSGFRKLPVELRKERVADWVRLHFHRNFDSLGESDKDAFVPSLYRSLENLLVERAFRSPKSD